MKRVSLKDVIMRVKEYVDKENTKLEYYIGGEHFEYGEVTIRNRAKIAGSTIGPAFHMRFRADDVLLMSRNPHLRKAGRVDFDGICSDVSYVCRTKDSTVLLQSLIPFIFQSDAFWKYAEEHKHGSTNFFLNWKDFEGFEFNLPEIEEQKKIADILWAFNCTKQSYEDFIEHTDALVKSQFIEMFGGGKCPQKKIRELFVLQMGKTPERKNLAYWDSDDYRWISIADLGNYDKYTGATNEHISQFAVDHSGIKIVPKDTVIMSFKLTIGRTAITSEDIYTNEAIMAFIPKEDEILQEFLLYALRYKDWSKGLQNAVKGVTLNKDLIGDARIIVPEKQAQLAFLSFMQQIDKSKFFAKIA